MGQADPVVISAAALLLLEMLHCPSRAPATSGPRGLESERANKSGERPQRTHSQVQEMGMLLVQDNRQPADRADVT